MGLIHIRADLKKKKKSKVHLAPRFTPLKMGAMKNVPGNERRSLWYKLDQPPSADWSIKIASSTHALKVSISPQMELMLANITLYCVCSTVYVLLCMLYCVCSTMYVLLCMFC